MNGSKKIPAMAMAALMALNPSYLLAEGGSMGGLSGQTVISGDGGAQVNEGAMMVNPNTIKDNSAENAQNGREYKAGDAQRQANAGKAAATAAAVAFFATGIPMSMSIIPSVAAAGRRLIAKGVIETAQAAASGAVANQNKAQKDLLKANAGQGGEQAKVGYNDNAPGVQNEISQALQNNPEVSNFLASQGVNTDDLAGRLANGEIRSVDDALGAIGDTATYTPEQQAEIAALESQAEKGGVADNMRILNDDSVKPRDGDTKGDGDGGSASRQVAESNAGTGEGLGQNLKALEARANAEALKALAAKGGAKGQSGVEGAAPAGGHGNLMAQIMGAMGLRAESKTARRVLDDIFVRMGIIRLNPKQNIFQLAHRNYRSFQKWRKQPRVRVAKSD